MAQANPWERSLELDRRERANYAPILTSEEARQGVISGRVRLVLAVSMMLVIVAFAIIFAVNA